VLFFRCTAIAERGKRYVACLKLGHIKFTRFTLTVAKPDPAHFLVAESCEKLRSACQASLKNKTQHWKNSVYVGKCSAFDHSIISRLFCSFDGSIWKRENILGCNSGVYSNWKYTRQKNPATFHLCLSYGNQSNGIRLLRDVHECTKEKDELHQQGYTETNSR